MCGLGGWGGVVVKSSNCHKSMGREEGGHSCQTPDLGGFRNEVYSVTLWRWRTFA